MSVVPAQDRRTLDDTPALRDTASMPVVRRATPAARTDDRVPRFAPQLRFSPRETHFPIEPSRFVAGARLRRYGWSADVRDAVWHPRRACWESIVSELPASASAVGPDIADACRLIQFEARGGGSETRNRRPCDPRNLWYGRRTGYALELADPAAVELAGSPRAQPHLLFDRYAVPTHAGVFDVVAYWFFFAAHDGLHEGDWTSVMVIHPEAGGPVRVGFASPAGGITTELQDVETVDDTHPVVWIEPGTHGACRTAAEQGPGDPARALAVNTWDAAPVRVPTEPWSSFDGAWGRVGAGPRTTGPLGPLFRRLDAGAVAAA